MRLNRLDRARSADLSDQPYFVVRS